MNSYDDDKNGVRFKTLRVGKFNGTTNDRYHLWRAKVQTKLQQLGLWGFADGTEQEPEWQPLVEEVPVQALSEYYLNLRLQEANGGPAPHPPSTIMMPNPMREEDWINSKEMKEYREKRQLTASLIADALGDDVLTDVLDEMDDPAALWMVLEDTYSAKTGTNILSLLQAVVSKKLGKHEQMANHIGHLDALYVQLSAIQLSDTSKDLSITSDIFKICMLLSSVSDLGEYDAVIEAIRGVSDDELYTDNYMQPDYPFIKD